MKMPKGSRLPCQTHLDFDLVPVKNHRLLRPVCFYAEHSSLFDLQQSDLFSVFTAEITKVRSHIEFCATGGSFRPIDKRERNENAPLILLIDEFLFEFEWIGHGRNRTKSSFPSPSMNINMAPSMPRLFTSCETLL